MIQYDSKIIVEFAERLYKQAAGIVISYTVASALVGLVGGFLGGRAVGSSDNAPAIYGIVLALVLGAIGYSTGQQKAFTLRLQAQTALCQVRIEENTRNLSRGEAPV